MPLVSFDHDSAPPYVPHNGSSTNVDDDDSVLDLGLEGGAKKKLWYHYLPLCLLLVLLLVPQYHVLVVLASVYLKMHPNLFLFCLHLLVLCFLTFCACSSLIVCVVRDPGPVSISEAGQVAKNVQSNYHSDRTEPEDDSNEDAENNLAEALLLPAVTQHAEQVEDDFNSPLKWCKKCWAPKPERTHHCSLCGRCVLKMDHHCPWLAQKCVGHWTYPSFLNLLLSITLVASYVCFLCSWVVYVAFVDPFQTPESTALRALILSLYTAVMSLTVGSFFFWHVYLVSTNQTTVESLSPFLLLRYLPSKPNPDSVIDNVTMHPAEGGQPGHSAEAATDMSPQRNLTNISRELLLSSAQRRRVRHAHNHIRLYDVGFRRNWAQVVGVRGLGWKGWTYRLICGGSRSGCEDGRSFPRNPRADIMLARLAEKLTDEDKLD